MRWLLLYLFYIRVALQKEQEPLGKDLAARTLGWKASKLEAHLNEVVHKALYSEILKWLRDDITLLCATTWTRDLNQIHLLEKCN